MSQYVIFIELHFPASSLDCRNLLVCADGIIIVRDGKRTTDRITPHPGWFKLTLLKHLKRVGAGHKKDWSGGWGRVPVPHALDCNHPNAPLDYGSEYLLFGRPLEPQP